MMFEDACSEVGALLGPGVRTAIVDEIAGSASDMRTALGRLASAMRGHTFRAGATQIALDTIIPALNRRTLEDGFSVLHDWHGPTKQFVADSIPVEVAHYIAGARGDEPANHAVLAMLLDYYLFYLLALLSLRVWDEGD